MTLQTYLTFHKQVFRRYLQLVRHCCKIPSSMGKTEISDFKAVFILYFPSQTPAPPKSLSLFNLHSFMQAWSLALTRRQETDHMQFPEKKSKKTKKAQKIFFKPWYFTKFIWRNGWIAFFVCFVLKLPIPKWTMSTKFRWGQVGSQPARSSLLHSKGILEGCGILQILGDYGWSPDIQHSADGCYLNVCLVTSTDCTFHRKGNITHEITEQGKTGIWNQRSLLGASISPKSTWNSGSKKVSFKCTQ